MRCISPMEYQSTAHWYQSYHWYQWTTGIPPYSYLIHCENILSPLNGMHFINGIPIDCLVSPLVPIVPLVPVRCISRMEYQSYHWYQWTTGIPPYYYLIHCENILSPLNEMNFTNGVLTDGQASPLESVCVYWTTLLYPLPR